MKKIVKIIASVRNLINNMTGQQVPIIVVLGATGAGKSKLALELAQKFNGEVISADAMQMYKGLDIVTNKVTPEERNLVKHHMIDFLDPLMKSTVIDFRNQTLPLIEDLRSKNVIPVICGGTNYYIESILWNILLKSSNEETIKPINVKRFKSNEDENDDSELSNENLYEKLKKIDPQRANHLHPNERRKILRSLEVFESTGRPHGQIIEEQKQMKGGSVLGGSLRFSQDQLGMVSHKM